MEMQELKIKKAELSNILKEFKMNIIDFTGTKTTLKGTRSIKV